MIQGGMWPRAESQAFDLYRTFPAQPTHLVIKFTSEFSCRNWHERAPPESEGSTGVKSNLFKHFFSAATLTPFDLGHEARFTLRKQTYNAALLRLRVNHHIFRGSCALLTLASPCSPQDIEIICMLGGRDPLSERAAWSGRAAKLNHVKHQFWICYTVKPPLFICTGHGIWLLTG